MRIAVHAVGRMKAGPEAELADRFFGRFAKIGPPVGLEWAGLAETVESRATGPTERKREEAARLSALLEPGSVLLLLDERGKSQGSEDLARWIAKTRDDGCRRLVVALGGPDGHDDALRGTAGLVLCMGKLTWPHQLARVMIAEQLYRCATILAGHPYHRV
ncbi:23S rRNA (pseudouridine(1915)-N(3))-methyltransferase RlmH [Nitratireductor sp. CAU 1489]|uniref:Ribosomal RNA large subunit methyltransferase H n=1 Tax=Nitratireductor arenosus TaxID=2682096 RepID=A0A844QCD5_9HYPH|nr:23S rRNA (pseudouridine(1915)-N(3))-methyltransferase RlmH [Nitratireductor arenosus]MVA96294.1 23S rRNA (pseudouridine(1915)-N(3))-methyltransferase RlmH [Nitratireductor arenosus]